MKFYLHSNYGDSLWLARRLLADGHDVLLHVRDEAAKAVGKGIVPLAPTPMPPADATVIFDSSGHGRMGEAFRRRGLGVIGGNPLDAELELDRSRGTQLMQASGIQVPETHSFTDFGQAKAFLSTHRGVWYFKPSGNQSTSLTHHGEAAELRRWLAWAQPHLKGVTSFELQRKVDGTEVSCEGWFDGEKWVPPFNATFEDKHFLTGNLGPRVGCASNVVWAFDDPDAELPRRTVKRLTNILRAAAYVGPIDLNCIIDGEGEPVGLEWSPRLGFDASQAWLGMLVDGDLGAQLAEFARGRLRRFSAQTDKRALTLRVTTPPYPTEHVTPAKEQRGLPLGLELLRDPRSIFVDDVMLDAKGEPCLAGRDGSVCCVGALGRDFHQLQAEVLRTVDHLRIPGKQHRLDPSERAPKAWAVLRDHGFMGRRLAAQLVPAKPSPGVQDSGDAAPAAPHMPPFVENSPNS
jgi:phosphoribosylamine-glycine ligase